MKPIPEPTPAPGKVDEEEEDPLFPDIAPLDISEDDPNYEMFKNIMERFKPTADEGETGKEANGGDKGEVFFDDDDDIPEEEEEGDKEPKLSKKKRKERGQRCLWRS